MVDDRKSEPNKKEPEIAHRNSRLFLFVKGIGYEKI